MPELNQFLDILKRHSIPQEENFSRLLGQTIHTLSNEDKKTRPCNKNKKPGASIAPGFILVEVRGFEPPASTSRT